MAVELAPALETLRQRCSETRFSHPGGPLPPVRDGEIALVARPPDENALAGLLLAADELGLKVAARGSGSKLDRGNPASRIDVLVDMSAFDAIVEHAAGDLTVTVQAGVPLDRLQRELAQAGQFLALDPPFPGTVGGLIATGDSGPRRLRYGGVRDQLLGVRFVRADGVLARGGGKVVKNVAGYDLPKLFTGSLGTLGIVTEAVFRLYSLTASSATLIVTGCSPLDAANYAGKILDSTLVPTTMDFALLDGATSFAVRFEGPAQSTATQAERARQMLGLGDISRENGYWEDLDRVSAAMTITRLILPTADLGRVLHSITTNASAIRAHMGHGHALIAWPEGSAEAILALRRRAEGLNGNLVLLRGASAVRAAVETWGDAGEGIGVMRRIKAEFDPKYTLNPGRFVGGI